MGDSKTNAGKRLKGNFVSSSKIDIDRNFEISGIYPRVYGSFTERMGRCIYEGTHEPGAEFADDDGSLKGVIALVQELGATIVRYPGRKTTSFMADGQSFTKKIG